MTMNEINIESAKYGVDFFGNNSSITVVIDGVTSHVPLDPANRHYAEIMRQVEDGSLVIESAEGEQGE